MVGGRRGAIASWAAAGQPHALVLLLPAIEPIVPPVVVVWQRRLTA